jgi:DNA-binding MurR/RpiR family transcriptional regulator
VEVVTLIEEHRDRFTPAERRVAAVVLSQPQLVAFGTVAELAAAAETSGASVIRLAAKLGLDGFSSLQHRVQRDLGRQLRPATARIRQPESGDLVGRALLVELDNAQATLEGIDPARFDLAVQALSVATNRVFVLTGDASRGIGSLVASDLSMLRPGVTHAAGSDVQVYRALAELRPADILLTLDLARYDASLIRAAAAAAARRATVVALTDSTLSPLARTADLHFSIRAKGVGPFDSYVGALVVLNVLVAGVAERRRPTATETLDRIEAAWSEADVFVDE